MTAPITATTMLSTLTPGHVGDAQHRAGEVTPDERADDAQDDRGDDAFRATHDQIRDEADDRPRTIHAMMPITAFPPMG